MPDHTFFGENGGYLLQNSAILTDNTTTTNYFTNYLWNYAVHVIPFLLFDN